MAEKAISVQSAQEQEPFVGGVALPLLFYDNTAGISPDYDNAVTDRDAWMRSFWKRFGNDLLSAVLAASVAKIQAQNWVLSGPKRLAKLYHSIIRDQADFGRGYDSLIGRGVQDYYTQDNGWFMERLRSGPTDHEGPCLGLSHLDSARMLPSGNADFPYYYQDIDGDYHLMHRSQFIRIVDLPSPVTALRHHEKGFCALSRALSTAMVLTLLVAMKREKLADLPPSAMAIFNNITKKQFESALSLQGAQEDAKGNAVWRSLLPLFGIDPAHPANIQFLSLREVWEGFDEMTAYNVAAYSFAAAWRMDPREFWPVSAGPLGTGKEVEVQAEKAKGKSTGLLFTQVERSFNHADTLPEGLTFKFELEDAGDELQQTQIHAIQIQNIKAMQDAGAQLNAAEVRYLLAMEYSILPREMIDVPEPPPEPGMDTSGLEAQGVTPESIGEMSIEEVNALAPQAAPAAPGAEGAPESIPGQPGKPGIPPVPGLPGSGVPGTSGVGPKPAPKIPLKLNITTVRIDDVEREFKEYYGMDLGPYVHIDAAGNVTSPFRWTTNGHNDNLVTPDTVLAAKSIYELDDKEGDDQDLLDKLKLLPKQEQKVIKEHADALRKLMDPTRRLNFLESIPDDVWDEAQAAEVPSEGL